MADPISPPPRRSSRFAACPELAGGEGQSEEEPAAAARLALHPDPPAVGFDDAFRDGETEPYAVRGRAVLALEVAVEDVRQVPRRDARAFVGDAAARLAVL